MSEIGRIRYVDLKEVWPDEARSFTPWLRDNSDVIGDLLGMELEFTAEHAVGKFSLDLFGHEVGTGQRVIVENQLAKSDHTHLGQLLTYAGGTEPSHVVWIAKEIREEHRAALEWLNHRTDSSTMFFGLELKAIRIGDSPAAPILDLVVEPNQWAKGALTAVKETEYSPKALEYKAFWADLLELLKAEIRELESINVTFPQAWLQTSVGFSGINLNLVFPKNTLRVELYLGSSDADLNLARFEALLENRDLVFGRSNLNFEFEELPGKKSKRIAVYGPFEDASVSNSMEHDDYKKWFLEVYLEFRKLVTGENFRKLMSNI